MKKVTKWFRKTSSNSESWEFNHLEDEHLKEDKPTKPQFAKTKPEEWRKEFAYLTTEYKLVEGSNV